LCLQHRSLKVIVLKQYEAYAKKGGTTISRPFTVLGLFL